MKSRFTDNVLAVVAKIPKGQVLTYAQVAEKAGSPKAVRAVGSIMKANKSPHIPCHRVVRSDGKPGSYNRGKKRKVEMLLKEGVIIQNGKVVL